MNVQAAADVLICSWAVAHGTAKPLRLGHGILERALKIAIDRGAFPSDFRSIRFVSTPVGLRAPDVTAMLEWAQNSCQLQFQNPFFDAAMVTLSKEAATSILSEMQIAVEDASRWGRALGDAIAELEGDG